MTRTCGFTKGMAILACIVAVEWWTAPGCLAQDPMPEAPTEPAPLQLPEAPAVAVAPVAIKLGQRKVNVTPTRIGLTHLSGGVIEMSQPSPDTLVISMSGVCVAGAHPCKDSLASICFDIAQDFEIAVADPNVKTAKLVVEGRVTGLLRTHAKGGGTACFNNACGLIGTSEKSLLTLCVSPDSASDGQHLSLNAFRETQCSGIQAGVYQLRQTFTISAMHPHGLNPSVPSASTECAADAVPDPLRLVRWEPFQGTATKDFGFQLTIKVVEAKVVGDVEILSNAR